MKAWQISKRKSGVKVENYSVSLISAISQDKVIANQFIQGGVDSSVYENFIYEVLNYVRSDESMKERKIVLFMDNARIHVHKNVIDTIMDMKAILILSA